MAFVKKIFLAFLLLATFYTSKAQQHHSYSQYMYNPLVINPAFAGYYKVPEVTFSGRSQLSSLQGSGSSVALSAHGKGPGGKTGLGVLASNDKIGVSNTTSLQGVYSYNLMSRNKNSYTSWGYIPTMFSLGLSAGVTRYSEDLTSLGVANNDPNFINNINLFLPTFGFGLYFSKDPWYVSASVPQLLNSLGIDHINLRRHLFLNGGVHLKTSSFTKLNINGLIKYVYGAPAQADINAIMTFHDKVRFGMGYRSVSLINFMAGINISNSFRFNYSYDIPLGSSRMVNIAVHEIMINYRLF